MAKTRSWSPLHGNIEDFVKRIALTEAEEQARHEVVEAVRRCLPRAFPDARGVKAEVFGSFANGMSTWRSDVDLVITGLGFEPDRTTGVYDVQDRGRVTARLRKIADQLRRFKRLDINRIAIIGRARMPIIKLRTRSNVAVDISISDGTGVAAARYMMTQAQVYPPLRPLALVLKAFLKSQRLNDVATGGLSSYSLLNMIVVHLQEELKCGRDVYDLGETLYSFFLRYGEEFDYAMDAVSVRSGGIVPKRTLPFAMDSARFAAATQAAYDGATSWHERLCVDCPLSGRDVSNGTWRIDVIRQAFFRAARQLEALARGRSISDTSIQYLQALFGATGVERVIRRVHVDDEDPFFKVVGGMEALEESMGTRGRGARFVPPGESFDEDEGENFEVELGSTLSSESDDVLDSEPSQPSRRR